MDTSTVEQETTAFKEGDVNSVKRTPEELEALRLRQQQLRDKFQPLLDKAKRQLHRAEQNFLEADDRDAHSYNEFMAMRDLYYAQHITDYYKSLFSDIEYAYKEGDLDWHQV